MPLVSMKQVLERAYHKHYAVGSFNVVNLHFLEAIVGTAMAKNSPVILSIAEAHYPYVTPENIVPAIQALAARTSLDIVLNLDHGLTMKGIERAIDNGFTNIMFDGSQLEFEENIRQTRQVVEICHPLGISVEAELGAVGGSEGGDLEGEADPSKYTNVEQARIFVEETKVDFLAIAFGNSHGKYKGEPDLDFERLKQLRDITGIPLVLHGGSGISPEDFRRAISLGIAKINFYTGMSQAALQSMTSYLNNAGKVYDDYVIMMKQAHQAVGEVVGKQMDIFGSTGQGRR
ncbi:MAG: ketose 1,6-bisphosphate aldolase [Bacteroidota bacterium]